MRPGRKILKIDNLQKKCKNISNFTEAATMLIRYGTSNHLSICDYQEISCAASKLKDDESHLIKVDERSLQGSFLPVVALYGANAAGKSNMADALRFMNWMIETSFRNPRDKKRIGAQACKLFGNSAESVSRYDCDVLISRVRYHYGFECSEEGIVREWLFSYPNGSKTILFERDFSKESPDPMYFGSSVKGTDQTLHDLATNTKSLFLSAVGQTSHPVFLPIHSYFVEHFVNIKGQNSPLFFDESLLDDLGDPAVRSVVEGVLRQADFGISSIEIVESPVPDEQKALRSKLFKLLSEATSEDFSADEKDTEKRVVFVHGEGEAAFRLQATDESTGTLHLLKLLVPTIKALREGKTLIIDEVTTTLHTRLSEELIKLFTNPATNPFGAQFIFTTHDTNLLGVLRRDEIWFVEKSANLKTSVFPLTDFRTRKSDNLETGYLLGRYGAVPSFGDLTRAIAGVAVGQKTPEGG